MNSFPLIRTKWSNEHFMALLFVVLILYQLPVWISHPGTVINGILLILFGLIIDAAANRFHYKRMWCSVSAAITASMISLLAQSVPLWGQLLGVAAALILGKHIWGGTGRNVINPAMVGLLVILFLFPIPYPVFTYSLWVLPASILSLIFLVSRPYAGLGLILGMAVSLLLQGDLTLQNVILYGVLFWGCVVATDPVTVTRRPVLGMVTGILAGFASMFLNSTPLPLIFGILSINLISAAAEWFPQKRVNRMIPGLRIPKVVPYGIDTMIDLSGEKVPENHKEAAVDLSAELILERVRRNEVFGMGGAAFPTHRKLVTVSEAKENRKYLIVNGVECDPGLIHDHYLLKNHMQEVIRGIEYIQKYINFTETFLAVKDTGGLYPPKKITMFQVPDVYPVGAEKILINEILHRELGSSEIPAQRGILVLNASTVYAIYHAVTYNQPVTTRYLTVANLIDRSAQIVKVRLGMKISDVMEAIYPGAVTIFAGGGIMQAHIVDEDSVIDKTVNFIATSVFPKYKESPQCSKCGNCSKVCPAGLSVNLIADLVDQGKPANTVKYHAADCISCGSCSYTCLAGRNLSAKVKIAKSAISSSGA